MGRERERITRAKIDKLRPGETIADDAIVGFMVKCLPSGIVSYAYRYTFNGKRKTKVIGTRIAPEAARVKAGELEEILLKGRDPIGDEGKLTRDVNWLLGEYLEARAGDELRSLPAIKAAFDHHVRPKIGGVNIYDLKKSTIKEMLDGVAKRAGPVMADRVMAYLRKAFNWRAAGDDDFVCPIVKGMARTKIRDRRRTRILDGEEIRDVIRAADELVAEHEAPPCYARYLRALLLTGLRRCEVANGHRDEIRRGRWIIPAERMKGKVPHLVPITDALEPLLGEHGFMFSNDNGKHAFSGFEKAKVALDRKVAELRGKPIEHWTLHDLRRTARSILSRYVTPDIAERVLAHAIDGVRAHYDLYGYEKEKRAALEALAGHINRVLHPSSKVVELVGKKNRLARSADAPARAVAG